VRWHWRQHSLWHIPASRFDEESGEWVRQRKCFDCGCMVDVEDACCSAMDEDDGCDDCGALDFRNCTCDDDEPYDTPSLEDRGVELGSYAS
jgi:hypothetical protein